MKSKLVRLLLLAGPVLAFLSVINAQQSPSTVSDLYVVSAEAGGINYIEGDVKIMSGTQRPAVKGEKMATGERLVTGLNSRAEILLNPGSFLRLSQNTEFELTSSDLNDLRIKLERGTAIIELYSTNDLTLKVFTPDTEFRLMKSGVYRIDVMNGSSKISVWKGVASVGGLSQRVIGKGNSITVSSGQYSEAKFDRDLMDGFDSWSKLRSAEVAVLNARLRRDSVRQSIMASMNDDWWWNNGTGIWVYDRYSRNRCFVPFNRRSNAYGHNLSQNVGNYNVSPPPATGNPNAGNPQPNPGQPSQYPGRGRKRIKDPNDDDDTRGRNNGDRGEGNANRRENAGDAVQTSSDSGQVNPDPSPRVPRKVSPDDDSTARPRSREERREERREREERRSREEDRSSGSGSSSGSNSGSGDSGGGSSSSSGGNSGSSQPSSPPSSPPPSNPSPPPDPPQRDSMPSRKDDPPR